MKIKILGFLSLIFFGLTGCGDHKLANDVAPLADVMCRFIEIQNNLQKAVNDNDSLTMHKLEADKHKLTIEMTIMNQEFQEKYGDKINDKEFGKKFKKEMNKALIECPHLSVEDRDRMEKEMKE